MATDSVVKELYSRLMKKSRTLAQLAGFSSICARISVQGSLSKAFLPFWKGPDYQLPATYINDIQYPRQNAMLALLRHERGRPLKNSSPMTHLKKPEAQAAVFAALPDKRVDAKKIDLDRLGYAAWL